MEYVYVPDSFDARDYKYVPPPIHVLPERVDLRNWMSKVEDQGDLGSCTGNAIVGALEFLENRNKSSFVDLSRLFVYYNERYLEGTVRTDAGARIRDGIKSIAKWGVCSENTWPYDVSQFKTRPSEVAFTEAASRKATSYWRVEQNKHSLLTALASGYPVVFGFQVYESMESNQVAKTGMLPMPSAKEKLLGGHAVLAAGYDLAGRKGVLCRNSWGPNWGIGGYFWMPFSYILDANLANDFWLIQK